MKNTFVSRLTAARKMAGLSLQNLADKLGYVLSKKRLNKYEHGKMKPDSDLVISVAYILHFPVDYLFSEPAVVKILKNMDFRKYGSKISKTEQEFIEEKAKEALKRYLELENILNLNEFVSYYNYPTKISTAQETEKAANELRKEWNLGYDPIPDVVEMLEDKGYKVLEIEAPVSFDGLKAFTGTLRVIAL